MATLRLTASELSDVFEKCTMERPDTLILRVTYMELRDSPPRSIQPFGTERIAIEHLLIQEYLALYRKVGASLNWDQRLLMPEAELAALLEGGSLNIHVLRSGRGHALGFCEFDRRAHPEIELRNFGLIPEAQGRGLGPWLLSVALREEWQSGPRRIWLHTDTWDHPAAIRLYERAGFRIYAVRDEESGASLGGAIALCC
jgi:ribosomal protein S18 acetylase RimI-like enzyme